MNSRGQTGEADKIYLVGYSAGGGVALKAAKLLNEYNLYHPSPDVPPTVEPIVVDGLVLIDEKSLAGDAIYGNVKNVYVYYQKKDRRWLGDAIYDIRDPEQTSLHTFLIDGVNHESIDNSPRVWRDLGDIWIRREDIILVARFQDTAWTPSTVSCREATTWYKAHTTSNGVKLYNYGSQSCATWRIPVGCRVGDCFGYEVKIQEAKDYTDAQTDHLPEAIRQIAKERTGGSPNDYLVLVRPDGYEVKIFSAYAEKSPLYGVIAYTGTQAEHDYYFSQWMSFEHFVFWNVETLRLNDNLAPGTTVTTMPLTALRYPLEVTPYTCRDENQQVRHNTFSADCTKVVKIYVADWELYNSVP